MRIGRPFRPFCRTFIIDFGILHEIVTSTGLKKARQKVAIIVAFRFTKRQQKYWNANTPCRDF